MYTHRRPFNGKGASSRNCHVLLPRTFSGTIEGIRNESRPCHVAPAISIRFFDRTIADVDGNVGPTVRKNGKERERERDGRAEWTDRDIVEVGNGGEVDNTARYPGGTSESAAKYLVEFSRE